MNFQYSADPIHFVWYANAGVMNLLTAWTDYVIMSYKRETWLVLQTGDGLAVTVMM